MNRRRGERGMTLIELVVVLGILAAISTLALAGVEGLGRRERADVTDTRLDGIAEAVSGNGMDYGRFVSDMGRLPVAHGAVDFDGTGAATLAEGQGLLELWDAVANAVNPDGYASAVASPDIAPVAAVDPAGLFAGIAVPPFGGWAGPYLAGLGDGPGRNPAAPPAGTLYDGFGNAFRLSEAGSAWEDFPSFAGGGHREVTELASFGADNAEGPGAEWADADVAVALDATATCTLHVAVEVLDTASGPAWAAPSAAFAAYAGARQNDTAYAPGQYVHYGDLLYGCATGTGGMRTDVTAPAGLAAGDVVVEDGDLTWVMAPSSRYLNCVRVVALSPWADPDPEAAVPVVVRQVTAWRGESGAAAHADAEGSLDSVTGAAHGDTVAWTGVGGVRIEGLTPGIRGLLAYGYFDNGDSSDRRYLGRVRSELLTVTLRPGVNYERVRLSVAL